MKDMQPASFIKAGLAIGMVRLQRRWLISFGESGRTPENLHTEDCFTRLNGENHGTN
jgi:hypothetical protein